MANQDTSVIEYVASDTVDEAEVADMEVEEIDQSDALDDILANQEEVHKNLDATQLYLGEIGYSPLLTAEEEVYFARRALKGDEASRKRMIVSNLRLVVKIARR